MAERRDNNIMKVKMPLSSVSFYLFVFTLLEVAVKSQMSSNSNSHSFIQDNSDVRYLVDNIPVSVHKVINIECDDDYICNVFETINLKMYCDEFINQVLDVKHSKYYVCDNFKTINVKLTFNKLAYQEFSSSPGVRVQNGKESIAVYSNSNSGSNPVTASSSSSSSTSSSSSSSSTNNGGVSSTSGAISSTTNKAHLKFEPPILDFKERHLGVPHHEKVTILNLDRNKTIHMTSISGSTVHFHSSFFEDKIIPPQGNTSFNVVFLGREEGGVESCLFIHTSEGSFKYEVKGSSIQSPYRLRPLSGVRLPLNASYSPLIEMHNPHSTTLQLVEVYSSGGEFHLELPSGELEGPKHLWEIPAFLTKPVIRVRFHARAQKNHTAYIRLKVNNSEEVLVVPLEVEVSSSAGLYCPDDVIDFGIGGSQDPPKQVKLELLNSWKKPIRVQNIISTPVSKSLKIDFEPVKVPPDGELPMQVAVLTFDWQAGLETGVTSGRVVIKTKQGNQKLIIPYTATVLSGGLLFDKNITKFRSDLMKSYEDPRHLYLTNGYEVPVAITDIVLQNDEITTKYFQLDKFRPVILVPNERKKIVELSIKRGVNLPVNLKLESILFIYSNISELTVPLLCYDGRLDTVIHSSENGTELHLGMVGSESTKEVTIAVINKNPVPVTLNSWGTSLTGGAIRIVDVLPGNKSSFLKSGGSTISYHKNNTALKPETVLQPKHYAVFHLEVLAGQNPGIVEGSIWIRTEFETIKIHTSFEVQHGSLIVEPQPIIFNDCFPGKLCTEQLSVKSQFTVEMTVTGVSSVLSDRRFSYTTSSPLIAPSSTSHLGLLTWDAEESNSSYLGIANNTVGWVQPVPGGTTDLPAYAKETDFNILNECYTKFINMSSQPLNLTLRLDTTQVRDLKFKAAVKLTWPQLVMHNDVKSNHIRFPLTQIGNVSLENLSIVNPSTRHSLLVQLVLENSYPMANGILNSLPEDLRPSCTDCSSSNSDEFFLVLREEYDSSLNPFFSSSSLKVDSTLVFSKKDVSFLIPPASNISVTLGFLPSSAELSSALLFIRNNLTVLEVVQLSGSGAYAQFKFGNRKPGSSTPLAFELVDKHLKDCESEKHRKHPAPNLTVKRSFTARNSGALPITVHGFHISGLPCEGYGFRVLNCEPFNLAPNSTRKIDIAFTPDFTLSRVQRTLSILMSNEPSDAANYTLVATLPPYLLATCSSVLARPSWEPLLYYSAVTFMIFLLVCVLAAAFLESDRVLKHALLAMSQDSAVQPVLDLSKPIVYIASFLMQLCIYVILFIYGICYLMKLYTSDNPEIPPKPVVNNKDSWKRNRNRPVKLVAGGYSPTSSSSNNSSWNSEPQGKPNDLDTSIKKKLASSNSNSSSNSGLNSVSNNKHSNNDNSNLDSVNVNSSHSSSGERNVNLLSSTLASVLDSTSLLGSSSSHQRRGSWASLLNNRCQTTQQQVQSVSSFCNNNNNNNNNNSNTSSKHVTSNLNTNLKASNNYNNPNSSNNKVSTSDNCNNDNNVGLFQHLLTSSSSLHHHHHNLTGGNNSSDFNNSKCTPSSSSSSAHSMLPVVPILRTSDLHSANSTKRNKSSVLLSSSLLAGSNSSSSSSSSSTSSVNSSKYSKKNNYSSHSHNHKRLLDLNMVSNGNNSHGSCGNSVFINNEDGDSSSTTTDSSSHDDYKDDGLKQQNGDRIDVSHNQSQLHNNIKYNNRQCRSANKTTYDNVNKKTDKHSARSSMATSNNNGGSVSSLDGDEDDHHHHHHTSQSSTSSSSSQSLSLHNTINNLTSTNDNANVYSASSNNNSNKKPHNRNLRKNNNNNNNGGNNVKSNKNTNESQNNTITAQGILNTTGVHSNKQSGNSNNRQDNNKLNNSNIAVGNNNNVKTVVNNSSNNNNLNTGRNNKDKSTPIKRRTVNDKANSSLIANNSNIVTLSHSKEMLNAAATPPSVSSGTSGTVRASFSDVVARTSAGPVSSVRLPASSTSLLSSCPPLSSSLSSSSDAGNINTSSIGLGPIGPKRSGRGDLGWLDQQLGGSSSSSPTSSSSSLTSAASLFGLDNKNSSNVSCQVQNLGGSVCSTGWSDSLVDSGPKMGTAAGSTVGLSCNNNGNNGCSMTNSLVLKVLQEAEQMQQLQQTQPAFKETWPSSIWEAPSLYNPPSSSSASVAPQLSVGSSVCPMWGSDVWAPPSAPWAPPGLAPRPQPMMNTSTSTSGLTPSDLDQGLEYHPFRSLSNIWSPTPSPSIWQPPTTK